MNQIQQRHAAGTPAGRGGQFAARMRADSAVTLGEDLGALRRESYGDSPMLDEQAIDEAWQLAQVARS